VFLRLMIVILTIVTWPSSK